MSALDELKELLSPLETAMGVAPIGDAMLNQWLADAVIPDANGVRPGEPDYIDTFDVFFAAITALSYLQGLPVVTRVDDDGTSYVQTTPNFNLIRDSWSGLSPIYQVTSQSSVYEVYNIPRDRYYDYTVRED